MKTEAIDKLVYNQQSLMQFSKDLIDIMYKRGISNNFLQMSIIYIEMKQDRFFKEDIKKLTKQRI